MDHAYSKGINTVRVNFANPNLQYQLHKKDIDKAIKKVLTSKSYVLGNEVKKFESEFSDYIGVKYSIGVANGTDAIEERARHELGMVKGDEFFFQVINK